MLRVLLTTVATSPAWLLEEALATLVWALLALKKLQELWELRERQRTDAQRKYSRMVVQLRENQSGGLMFYCGVRGMSARSCLP